MATVTGGLMSLRASGTIANTLTYADWKGISYVRTRVIPANPRSIAQTSTRSVFTYLGQLWKYFPGIAREPWEAAVTSQALTAANLFFSKNISDLRSETDLALINLSAGALGGIPPTAMVLTPGSGSISAAVTAPSAPTGWTLTAAQGVAVRDQDPHLSLVGPPVAVEDLTSTYTLVFSGLAHTQDYQVASWLKWLTATGGVAYSTALLDTATTT